MILTSQAFQAELDDAAGRVVRSKIETYDTKMCTDTTGIPFVLYEWDGSGNPDWSGYTDLTQVLPADSGDPYGVVPNLSLNWAYSSPFYLNLPYYGIEFDGYFYAEESSSDFGFYVFGDGQEVELIFNSTTHVTAGAEVHHIPFEFASSSSGDSVTGGQWYTFQFRVWGATGGRFNGITLMYTYDLSGVDEDNFAASDLEVVNCGVANVTNDFLAPVSVTHFNDISGNRKRNEPTEYEFTVPLGDEDGAYIRNSINEYVSGSIELHEGRLIKIYAGYDCDTTPVAAQTEGDVVGNVEYIPRFTGFIYGFQANRNDNKLTVKCRDFFSRTEEVFCVNYPEPTSYWSSGYFLHNQPGEPDGIGMPIAYDRWNVVSAIRDLFIKAGIPPSLFYSYEKGRATNGNAVDTGVRSVYDSDYNLSSAMYYGEDIVEEYINRFDTGTTVFEAIMKIVDTYGYNIEFKPDGNLRFFPQNNPTGASVSEAIIDDTGNDDPADDGVRVPGVSAARGGGYTQVSANNEFIRYGTYAPHANGISGDGFALLVVRDTLGGASDNSNQYWSGTSSVDVDISIHGGASVYSGTFNLYMSETWYYNNGVYPALGHNPCYIPLTRSLDYDQYDITITADGDYTIKVDEIWAYQGNVSNTAVKTLQTFKASNIIASLSSVDYERSMEDLRNDILVVGQRKGIWVADGSTEVGVDDPEFSADNNQQFVNYHSRAVDVESIYNPAASNYTGRHLMTYVQEPSINTYARADWLSFNMLNAYREYKNRVNFSLIGDPEVYINDPITVKDKVEEDGLNTVWVDGFSESISKTSWNIRMDVVGNAPYPSYTEDADFPVDDEYNGRYFSNLEIVDNFGNKRDGSMRSGFGSAQAWGASPVTVADATGWDDSGTIVVYRDDVRRYGVFTYTSRSGNQLNGVTWRFQATGGEVDDAPSMFLMDAANIYNPYEEADYGGFMNLQFTSLVTGSVSVGVKTLDHGVYSFIAGLSNGGGLDDRGLPKDQSVYPGETVQLIWGGVDEPGVTHLAVPEASDIVGGGYFTQDGRYYFTVDYRRESDGEKININTSSYDDEDGNPQTKLIELAKSAEDEHTLDYTFLINPRNKTGQYFEGSTENGQSRGVGNNEGNPGRVNENYIWVSSDGDIEVTLKSYYIDTKRSYHVVYSVNAADCELHHIRVNNNDYLISTPTTELAIDKADFQGGIEIRWDNTFGYKFTMNPDWNDYGALHFDSKWNNFTEEYDGQPKGQIYWFRLILDIRDGSGRRIKYRAPNGDYSRLPSNQGDMWSQVNYAYSERNWDTTLELMQIPRDIHEEVNGAGTFGFYYTMAYREWNVPYFEALQTPIHASWADGTGF